MDKLRREILSITKRKPEIGLNYYIDLLDIIDEFHEKKPDTSIETCKAIIEGVSKLILHTVKQEPIAKLDESKDLKNLFKNALDSLSDRVPHLDVTFNRATMNVVRILGDIRNDHSDIGHGRASVKQQISCPHFSQMIAGFTESITVYLLIKLDTVTIANNAYESEQMQDFNQWLDDSIENFPIEKERYSKLLYQTDSTKYYAIYNDDYLEEMNVENEEEMSSLNNPSTTPDLGIDLLNQEESNHSFDKNGQPIIEDICFNGQELEIIAEFAQKYNLKKEALVVLLNEVSLRQMLPSPIRCLDTINFKLKLHDREGIKSELRTSIVRLIDRLRIIEK